MKLKQQPTVLFIGFLKQIELLNEENNTKEQKIKARNWLLVLLILLVIVIICISNFFFRQRASHKLIKMELDIQKHILKIRDLKSVEKNEPEINSNEFSIKYDLTERETEVLHLINKGMPNMCILILQ